MTLVRRILIGIVGVLLLLDATALAIVKFSSGPTPSKTKSKVVIWIDDKGEAESAESKLKELGYTPILKPAERDKVVDANFRVVMSGSRREMLEPVARVLKKSGHKSLSFNDDGTLLYYGGVYKTEKKAKAVVKSLKAKESLVFEVKPGKKKVKVPSHRVILLEVPDNMITDATDPVENDESINVQSIDEIPLEPKEEEEASEEE